jgi:hypothetical protein
VAFKLFFFKEGLNPLYHLGGLMILGSMAKQFPSIKFLKVSNSIKQVKEEFESKLEKELDTPQTLNFEVLKRKKLLKEKYSAYASFLAAISSYPLLYKVAEGDTVNSSIFAKTAMITSIKLLDNINDQFHNFAQAEESQRRYEAALTQPSFILEDIPTRNPSLIRAENSVYKIARWAYHTLPFQPENLKTFKSLTVDMREFIDAQIMSFYQKSTMYDLSGLNFSEYLKKVTAKASGTLWVDVDLCFYEASEGTLDSITLKSLEYINRSIDLLFRALIIWDDVTDLMDDLRDSIINSTMMLGLETGKLSPVELERDAAEVVRTLEERGVISDAIHLGNLVFLSAVEQMQKADELNKEIDVNALIYCARVLRLFLLRKHVAAKKDLKSIRLSLRSFDRLENFKDAIPSYLWSYGNLVVNQPAL